MKGPIFGLPTRNGQREMAYGFSQRSDKNLLLWLPLDRDSGFLDRSQYRNDVVKVFGGLVAGNVADQNGVANKATSFNSALLQYLDLDDVCNLGYNDATICCWFKPTNTAETSAFITKVSNLSTSYAIYLLGSNAGFNGQFNTQFVTLNNNINHVTSAAPTITYNAWNFIVWSIPRTPGLAQIYVNNVFKASTNFGGTSNTNGNQNSTSKLLIGARDIASSRLYSSGSMKEIRIYNRLLSTAEMTYLYQNT